MTSPSFELLKSAVLALSLSSLALAAVVYFLMQVRYRNQLAREAWRLMLASFLPPSWDGKTLSDIWLSCTPSDREIVEEVLIGHRQVLEAHEAVAFERGVTASVIYEHWLRGLRKGNVPRRVSAALRLGHFRDPRGVAALVAAAAHASPEVALAVALSLGRLRDPGGLPGLMHLTRRPPRLIPDITLAAALLACAEGCPDRLVSLLNASEARVRVIGAWALSETANAAVLPQLRRAARDPHAEVRAKVARALSRLAGFESVETLNVLARDPVWFVRVRALDALGKLRDPAGEPTALAGLDDQVREVRYRAASALRQMTGMKGETVLKVLDMGSRRNFDSLISEWERAGFLWQVVGGLSASDGARFAESWQLLKALVAGGVTRALEDFVLAFPDIKVRLRLVRLLADAPSPGIRANLLALARLPECDRRVAAAIRARVREAHRMVSTEAGSIAS